MPSVNLHGTAVLLGDRGVLIAGASGSGKTTLAMELIASATARGSFARLVADDQLLIRAANGRLIAQAPAPIRGLVEVYGLGPMSTPTEDIAVIDLMVGLAEAKAVPRLQESRTQNVGGIDLPLISVAAKNARAGVAVIFALLPL